MVRDTIPTILEEATKGGRGTSLAEEELDFEKINQKSMVVALNTMSN
ncbi:MAG: hypothetical protein WAM14_10650 [Candidatus Nitrosopolaris sp.]